MGKCQGMVSKKKSFVIVGPGSMGMLLGSYLEKRGDVSVILFDKDPERASFLAKHGIEITTGWDMSFRAVPDITTSIEAIKKADVILFATKSYALKIAADMIKGAILRDAIIIGIQNGIAHVDILMKAFPDNPVVFMVTSQGATKIGHNRVFHAGKGATYIGGACGIKAVEPYIKWLQEIFSNAGIDCEAVGDIIPIMWKKLIINCAINPLTALTKRKNGELLEEESIITLMEILVKEVLTVTQKNGIDIGLNISSAMNMILDVCNATKKNTSSMLQDVLLGKQTEIDAINGQIVRIGKKLGCNVPINLAITLLIKGLRKKLPQT